MFHHKCNITHITHNNKEYEVYLYYSVPPIKFVTLINKMKYNRSTASERSVINNRGFKPVLRELNPAMGSAVVHTHTHKLFGPREGLLLIKESKQ